MVCIHDYDKKQVAGKNLEITKHEWEDLHSLDVGPCKDPASKGEGIPLFKDALIEGPNDLLWVLEIKCGEEIVESLLAARDEIGLVIWERITVI